MSEQKTFREMSDSEIVSLFRSLANRFESSNDPVTEFKAYVKEQFGCSIASSFSSPNGAGQRMHMGMVSSPTTGKTLSF